MVRIHHHLDADRERSLAIMLAEDDEALVALVGSIWRAGGYRAVAEVEGSDRNRAYRLTQNGVDTDSWTLEPPPGLRPLVEPIMHNGRAYGHRSTMVGDIMECAGEYFVVARIGYVPLALETTP